MNKKPKRIFSAYGKLDQKTRNWRLLSPVNRNANSYAKGEELVYRMNETTLEIGQGMSHLRGLLWLIGLAGLGAFAFGFWITFFIALPRTLSDGDYDGVLGVMIFTIAILVVIGIPAMFFCLYLFLNDLFGYIDAPVRFDRIRRKIYVWASPAVRKEGPLELDWDQITPVAQSVSAPPFQVNAFKSVLLVDMDANGDVRFERRIPRIAQIGAALLTGEDTLAAYEYVRRFMEHGPDSLSPVKTHLVLRPRGMRPFVDGVGFLSIMRPYFNLPEHHQRSPGLITVITVLGSLFSMILVPYQWSAGIAQKWTTRLPRWPQRYDELAASGGPMQPPAGSEANDPPLLLQEKLIAALWHACAIAGYGWFVWHGMKH
ncbi:MAG: hypothetical protein LBF16_13975 [Pseudomonadales bacterium]|jgi:hypothetical protein|nr:hypothetical protein [Pseudomonadales bacterium]